MQITDFIPHGMVVAFGGIVAYVFRDHVKQDDARFEEMKTGFKEITDRQTVIADKMAENHTEILKVLLTVATDRATIAAVTEQAINRDRPPGRNQS